MADMDGKNHEVSHGSQELIYENDLVPQSLVNHDDRIALEGDEWYDRCASINVLPCFNKNGGDEYVELIGNNDDRGY